MGPVSKHFFKPFGPLFGPNFRGGEGRPPGSSPRSATEKAQQPGCSWDEVALAIQLGKMTKIGHVLRRKS